MTIKNRPLQHRRPGHRPNHNRRPHSSDRWIRRLKHKSSEVAHSSNSIQTRRCDGDVRVCFVVVFPGGGGFVFCYSDGDTEAEIREDGEEIEGQDGDFEGRFGFGEEGYGMVGATSEGNCCDLLWGVSK